MYTISDVASALGLKVNKFRYWLKKNSDDCENNLYDFRLLDLMPKVHIYKKVKGRAKARNYEQYIILDLEEFIEQYNRYTNFVENMKKRRGKGKWFWSVSAIECYQANMNCEKCFNKKIAIFISIILILFVEQLLSLP